MNNVMMNWLTNGGDYEEYTDWTPYKVVLESVAGFAFEEAVGQITGIGGD